MQDMMHPTPPSKMDAAMAANIQVCQPHLCSSLVIAAGPGHRDLRTVLFNTLLQLSRAATSSKIRYLKLCLHGVSLVSATDQDYSNTVPTH